MINYKPKAMKTFLNAATLKETPIGVYTEGEWLGATANEFIQHDEFNFDSTKKFDSIADLDFLVNKVNPEITLIERLGEGGIGIVYLAEDNSRKEQVAVKVLNPEYMYMDSFDHRNDSIKKFKREFNTGVELKKHLENTPYLERIVNVHQYNSKEDLQFFTMEYLNGGDLADFMHKFWNEKKISQNYYISKGLEYGLKTLEGLEALHNCDDLVHRDLKPSNILLSKKDNKELLKITDFGLSQSSEALNNEKHSGFEGTLIYGSPEQILPSNGKKIPITKKSDIYSFGSTFYSYFSGKFPIEHPPQDMEILSSVIYLDREYSKPKDMSNVPEEIRPILDWTMKRDTNQRAGSALETKYALVGAALRSGVSIDEIRNYAIPFEKDIIMPMCQRLEEAEDSQMNPEIKKMIREGLQATGHEL